MRVQLFGERCSGTNYIQQVIADNTDAEFASVLGWKHNFPAPTDESIDLVVVCARHPFTWAQSLYQTPWGAWDTYSGLPFDEFLRTPWRSKFDEYDVGPGSGLVGEESRDDWDRATGAPFGNPLLMRSGKYAAWLGLASRYPVYVSNLEVWQADPVAKLAELREYGLVSHSEFVPCPFYKGRDHLGHYKPRVYPRLTSEQCQWIRSQLDLSVERELVYFL